MGNSAIRFAVLTLSDRSSRGERPDTSGAVLAEEIKSQGWLVNRTAILPDEYEIIVSTLIEWCDRGQFDVILTTGGTGFSPRDVTPEATQQVIFRPAPGLQEAIRFDGLKTTPHAMLSRGIAGIRGNTLIINLPGSPKGALESFKVVLPVLPHAVQILTGDPGAEEGHKKPR